MCSRVLGFNTDTINPISLILLSVPTYYNNAMTQLRAFFIAGWLGSGALAYPSDVSLVPRDSWSDHMKKLQYPSNADVCKMVTNKDKDAWTKSKASDYFSNFMLDHGNKIGVSFSPRP